MIARLLISSSQETRVEEIKRILSEAGLKNPHPDLLYFPSDSKLGIGEARKIKEHFSFKPLQGKGRAVVLEDTSTLTIEAQNALLKTLEEPPADAIIILGAPSDVNILPTILSRCQTIRLQLPKLQAKSTPEVASYKGDIEKLLESSIADRFEYVEKLKDREEFLHFMVSYFHQKLAESTHERRLLTSLNFLKELLQVEEWAKQNVNPRAILEYLMLVMPPKK